MSVLRSNVKNYKLIEFNITLGGITSYDHFTGVRDLKYFEYQTETNKDASQKEEEEEQSEVSHPGGGLRSTITCDGKANEWTNLNPTKNVDYQSK